MTDRHYDNLLQKIKNELEDIQKDRTLTTDDQAFGFWVAERIFNVDPTDAEIGHEKAHHMAIVEVSDERRTMTMLAFSAGVAAGGDAIGFEAGGQSLQTHHEVLNHRAVVLGETGKHA